MPIGTKRRDPVQILLRSEVSALNVVLSPPPYDSLKNSGGRLDHEAAFLGSASGASRQERD